MQFFKADESNSHEQSYESKQIKDRSWQRCTANVSLWTQINGKYDTESLGMTSPIWKDGTTLKLQSGFRIWRSPKDVNTFVEADAEVV